MRGAGNAAGPGARHPRFTRIPHAGAMAHVPRIIGHRGAPALAPEHTRASYRLAFAGGADLVEPDVVPTRDGALAVLHGPLLDETTDVAARPEFADRYSRKRFGRIAASGWFAEDFDWDELRELRAVERWPEARPASAALDGAEGPLRLRELVELVAEEAPGTGLVIELKHDARALLLGHDFVDLLERELDGLWDSPALEGVAWESFETAALHRLRERGIPGKRIALVGETLETMDGEEGPERLTAEGLDDLAEWGHGVSVRTGLLVPYPGERAIARGRSLVTAAHERGLEVMTFTLRGEPRFVPEAWTDAVAHWRALAATGVDAVFADDPAAVRAALAG